MSMIGNYSHRQLVAIICQLIGKAHGTDGCFELVKSAAEAEAAKEKEEALGLGGLVTGAHEGEAGSGGQIITTDIRFDDSPVYFAGSLTIGQNMEDPDADVMVEVSEPYGTVIIA